MIPAKLEKLRNHVCVRNRREPPAARSSSVWEWCTNNGDYIIGWYPPPFDDWWQRAVMGIIDPIMSKQDWIVFVTYGIPIATRTKAHYWILDPRDVPEEIWDALAGLKPGQSIELDQG